MDLKVIDFIRPADRLAAKLATGEALPNFKMQDRKQLELDLRKVLRKSAVNFAPTAVSLLAASAAKRVAARPQPIDRKVVLSEAQSSLVEVETKISSYVGDQRVDADLLREMIDAKAFCGVSPWC